MKKILTVIGVAVVLMALSVVTVQARVPRPQIISVEQSELRQNDNPNLVRLTIVTNTQATTVWVRHSYPELFPRARQVSSDNETRTWEIAFTPSITNFQYVYVYANVNFVVGGDFQGIFITNQSPARANEHQMEILSLINDFRYDNDLTPLTLGYNLGEIQEEATVETWSLSPQAIFNVLRRATQEVLLNEDSQYITFTIYGNEVTISLSDENTLTPLQMLMQSPLQPDDPFHIVNLIRAYGVDEAKNIFEREVFRLTNVERVNHGLQLHRWHEGVARVAREHSRDMSINNFQAHRGSDGNSPTLRIWDAGIDGTAGEIINSGRMTPSATVGAWMNSPTHRGMILCRGGSAYLGAGIYFQINNNGQVIQMRATQKFHASR